MVQIKVRQLGLINQIVDDSNWIPTKSDDDKTTILNLMSKWYHIVSIFFGLNSTKF